MNLPLLGVGQRRSLAVGSMESMRFETDDQP